MSERIWDYSWRCSIRLRCRVYGPWQFLKASKDAIDDANGQKKMSVRQFSKLFDEKVEEIGINPDLIKRSLNEGFSGGERKAQRGASDAGFGSSNRNHG